MNEHDSCQKESEFLRRSLENSKASALNFQKQLAIKSAGMDFALKAGTNAARKADEQIKELNEIIDQLFAKISEILVLQGKTNQEIQELMADLPGYNWPGKIGVR